MIYRWTIINADAEYSANTASVPHAARRSASSMMRFLFHRSAIAPARNRNPMVGRKEQSVSSDRLDALPFWLYTQMTSA